jgi:CDP-diacylglycerol--serine O-phosphatidyltransferase
VALRLARFNVESDEDDDHMQFNGLPSPAAAGALAGFAILFYYLRLDDTRIPAAAAVDTAVQMALPFYGLVLAVLMVSRIPYPHVVNQFFRGQRSFGHVVALVLSLLIVMAVKEVAVPLLFLFFVVGPPVWHLWHRVRQRQADREPLF